MSEAIIFEDMPYNLFLKQRLEFVVICQDHLAANIMRVFEKEMIKRKEAWQARVEKAMEEKKTPPPEPKTYWVRLSQAQIIARLYMYDSAKLKKPEDTESEEYKEYLVKKALSISKPTLVKAINLLIAKGFLLTKSKQGDEFGAPLYTLHKQNIQAALKTLPRDPFGIFHQGGVENFESGGESNNFQVPPKNFESGESKNFGVPVSEIESPQSQNFGVFIDITNRDPLERDQENQEEGILPECESASTVGAIAPSLSESSLLGNESLEEISTPTEEPPQEIPAPPAQEPSQPEPPQQQQHAAPTQRRSAKKEPPPAAWTARAMVAKAEALRERPYTDKQRPKEVKAAQKLLEQKPDITPEEFERVFQQRNDAWWREHNGPLNVTDLAATPKDKNDLRYMLVLAQIQREAERKKPPADQRGAAPPAPVRPLVADSSSVAQIQAMRARKMAERAQSQGGR